MKVSTSVLEAPAFELAPDSDVHAGVRVLTAIAEHFDLEEAHAAARWARSVVRILDCPKDPRTIAGWGRWIAVSPGALRNWCRTAGIQARRSLLFGRLLRAVVLGENGRHRPENLLDVVDRRTLAALLRCAGFAGEHDFPKTPDEFLTRQRLVCDPDALAETRRALRDRQQRKGAPAPPAAC